MIIRFELSLQEIIIDVRLATFPAQTVSSSYLILSDEVEVIKSGFHSSTATVSTFQSQSINHVSISQKKQKAALLGIQLY